MNTPEHTETGGTSGTLVSGLLLIVPAFNEQQALAKAVSRLIPHIDSDSRVLVVNDGSTDQTAETLDKLAQDLDQLEWINLPVNSGIGAAVQTGLIFALENGYEHALQYDGDGQHAPACIPALLQAAQERGLDLCIGSRFLDPGSPNWRSTPLRRVGIRFFSRLIGLLCGVCISDPTSGFRYYGPRAIRLLAHIYPDDYPEPEAVFFCARNGFRIGEVPVQMYRRTGGVSSIRYFRSGYYMMKVTLSIMIDRLRAREVPRDEC